MKKIDSQKVADITSNCGKRLKVNVIMGLFVEMASTLENKNQIVMEAKKQLGDELFNSMMSMFTTFFALNLLAKTHNSKEFEAIFKDCQFEEHGSEA